MSGWWEAFWFFLPAGFANMAPIIACKLPGLRSWNTPIDLGKSWRDKRIFGNNKTWRGLLAGAITAAVVGWFQYRFITTSPEPLWFILVATATMGFGALLGDAVKSFFKRLRGIPAGESWVPFDQIDFIIGGLVFVSLFIRLSLQQIVMIFVLYFTLHLVVSYIGYLTGFKKKPI